MARIDFHCHTKYSKCSNLEPKTLLKRCKKLSIQGIMICDHNTNKGVHVFKKLLSNDKDFLFIPGIEISTSRGEIIGAWIEEDLPTFDFPDVVEEIRERGGMVIIPHPYDTFRSKRFRLTETDLPYIDAIETFNSRCMLKSANKKALQFAKDHSLRQTAGSDAHFVHEIGNAWISFNGVTMEEFGQSLKKGEVEISGNRASFTNVLHTVSHRLKRIFR